MLRMWSDIIAFHEVLGMAFGIKDHEAIHARLQDDARILTSLKGPTTVCTIRRGLSESLVRRMSLAESRSRSRALHVNTCMQALPMQDVQYPDGAGNLSFWSMTFSVC